MNKTGPRDDASLAAIRLEWWPRSNWNWWPTSSESAPHFPPTCRFAVTNRATLGATIVGVLMPPLEQKL
jgi:hypothetical protein